MYIPQQWTDEVLASQKYFSVTENSTANQHHFFKPGEIVICKWKFFYRSVPQIKHCYIFYRS